MEKFQPTSVLGSLPNTFGASGSSLYSRSRVQVTASGPDIRTLVLKMLEQVVRRSIFSSERIKKKPHSSRYLLLSLAQKSCQGLVFLVFTHAVVWVDPAVERFCLLDRARVEACFLSFQEGATLRNENSVSIVRVSGINRYVLQDVSSSLSLPTQYVLVGRLKRPPMNDTAVPRSLALVSLQQLINRIRPYAAGKL